MGKPKAKTKWGTIAAGLATVDWPRTLQRAGTFMRELRGDGDTIDVDTARDRASGMHVLSAIEALGRRAVGCKHPERCNCPFCQEQRP